MRPWLRWTLAITAILSTLALWWPDDVSHATVNPDSFASPISRAEPAETRPAVRNSSLVSTRSQGLPSRLATAELGEPTFDPFVGVQAPPVPAPKPFVGPVYVPSPLPVAVPAPSYRFLGQMVGPDGKRTLYLTKDNKEFPVSVGDRLDDGYVVESISPEGVRLYYPSLDVRVLIAVPTAPDSTQR